MDTTKQVWLQNAAKEAGTAGHIFAEMASCEAALESNFGQSGLAKDGNNLFGMKAHTAVHSTYGTLSMPTREYLNGQWQIVTAFWVKYPTLAACFSDRMATLTRLRDTYPHYEMALTAPDEFTYIREVSQTWATDPHRADKVISIYKQYFVSGTQPLNLGVDLNASDL
jgi:flagellum-specific peptidoglycan hydrolase FlgJ